MNAPAEFADAKLLLPVDEVLRLLAESGASSCWLFSLDVADIADVLQDFAQRTGLVDQIGQDAVQVLISAPFARYPRVPEKVPLAPEPEPEPPPRRGAQRTPQATVDAFKFVMSLDDPDYLSRWLRNRPQDAPAFRKILDGSK